MEEMNNQNLVQPVIEQKKLFNLKLPIIIIVIILAGLFSGYVLSIKAGTGSGANGIINTKNSAGVKDTKAFPDQAEGILEKGGFEGEGTHKLIMNPNDSSQTAYLTSTLINLNDFVGKKVRVWGQTFTAQKAGWLMDVGRVEVIQ